MGGIDLADALYVQLPGSYSIHANELQQRKHPKYEGRTTPLLFVLDGNRRCIGSGLESDFDICRREKENMETMIIRSRLKSTRLRMTTKEDLIDESKSDTLFEKKNDEMENDSPKRKRKRDVVREFIRNLASLSLEDYKWRSALFKEQEADRKMEETLARMRGEEPPYLRPMDATEDKIGPLGVAEKRAVEWLSNVIEEEGKRAKQIAEGKGDFIRPMDAALKSSDTIEDGPLAELERRAVSFFQKIRESETERVVAGKLRPMELDESKRGPLGEAELRAVLALGEISESEKLRYNQSRARGGDVVRPIDVPGPLGEIEKTALEVVFAERQRMKDKENQGKFVRPKDASVEGPLGKAEREVVKAIERLKMEEQERLGSIQRMLEENRPMEADRVSILGLTEALVVGLIRAPRLLISVMDRVKELMQSENLNDGTEKQLNEDDRKKIGTNSRNVDESP